MTRKQTKEIESITKNDVASVESVLGNEPVVPVIAEEDMSVVPEGLQVFVGQYTVEQLSSMYNDEQSKLVGKVLEADLNEFTVTAVINLIRKEKKKSDFKPKAEATRVVGFIIGDAGTWDKIASMIAQAKSYIKKNNIAEAINAGFINGDGAFLDKRQKIFGKTNDNYGNPLTGKESDCSRTMYLCARLGDDETYKVGTIQTNDPALCRGWGKASLHQFTPCATWGIVKETTATTFKLNASLAEETTSVFQAINEEMNVGEIFLGVAEKSLTEITKVETMFELIKEAWDRFMYVQGKVSWIGRDRPSPFGSIKMGIMDAEGNELIIELPDQVSKDFGELSTIIAYGKPDRSDLKVTDESTNKSSYLKGKGPVILKAVGVYVVKATPSDIYSTDASGNVKEIEGWV